jgi:hypothetical protein
MTRRLTRKEFLTLTVATGAALVAEACGDDSSGAGGAGATGSTTGSGTTGSPSSATGTGSGTNTTGSGAGTTSATGGGSCAADIVAEISCPHDPPHELTIPAADVAAGMPKTYDIKGQANHSHMISLSAADFAALKAGQPVYKFAESMFQDHCVTITCGGATDPEGSGQCDGGNAFTCA